MIILARCRSIIVLMPCDVSSSPSLLRARASVSGGPDDLMADLSSVRGPSETKPRVPFLSFYMPSNQVMPLLLLYWTQGSAPKESKRTKLSSYNPSILINSFIHIYHDMQFCTCLRFKDCVKLDSLSIKGINGLCVSYCETVYRE